MAHKRGKPDASIWNLSEAPPPPPGIDVIHGTPSASPHQPPPLPPGSHHPFPGNVNSSVGGGNHNSTPTPPTTPPFRSRRLLPGVVNRTRSASADYHRHHSAKHFFVPKLPTPQPTSTTTTPKFQRDEEKGQPEATIQSPASDEVDEIDDDNDDIIYKFQKDKISPHIARILAQPASSNESRPSAIIRALSSPSHLSSPPSNDSADKDSTLLVPNISETSVSDDVSYRSGPPNGTPILTGNALRAWLQRGALNDAQTQPSDQTLTDTDEATDNKSTEQNTLETESFETIDTGQVLPNPSTILTSKGLLPQNPSVFREDSSIDPSDSDRDDERLFIQTLDKKLDGEKAPSPPGTPPKSDQNRRTVRWQSSLSIEDETSILPPDAYIHDKKPSSSRSSGFDQFHEEYENDHSDIAVLNSVSPNSSGSEKYSKGDRIERVQVALKDSKHGRRHRQPISNLSETLRSANSKAALARKLSSSAAPRMEISPLPRRELLSSTYFRRSSSREGLDARNNVLPTLPFQNDLSVGSASEDPENRARRMEVNTDHSTFDDLESLGPDSDRASGAKAYSPSSHYRSPKSPQSSSGGPDHEPERGFIRIFGWGVPVPKFINDAIGEGSWIRLSDFIVRNAPCFWPCCSRPLETSATDRAILYRLNLLCAFFALAQVAVGLFLFIVQTVDFVDEDKIINSRERHEDTDVVQLNTFEDGDSQPDDSVDIGEPPPELFRRQSLIPNLWTLNGMVYFAALVGFVVLFSMLCTLRVIREVNLIGAMRFLWTLYWVLPVEIFITIGLFDYHRVTEVWIKHWWTTFSMAWFRLLFCEDGTAHTKCMVPIGGGKYFDNSEQWCLYMHGSTDCQKIRDDAELKMVATSYIFFTSNAVMALLLVVLLLLTLAMLEGIISSPIVQASKESSIPTWLIFPTLGCVASGAILLFSPSSVLATDSASESNVVWIGGAYMASGCAFFITALLGQFISTFSVLSLRDKRQKQIAISAFIITMTMAICCVVAIFIASLAYSVNLVQDTYSREQRGRIACSVDTVSSCSNCEGDGDFDEDSSFGECPEWDSKDLLKVLRTQLKQSATLAAIFFIYAVSALRFGFVLQSHVARYQIEYV